MNNTIVQRFFAFLGGILILFTYLSVMRLSVIVYETNLEKENYKLAFTSIERQDNSLPKGSKLVVQSGEFGLGQRVLRSYTKNGIPYRKKIIASSIIKPSKPRIIKVGTAPVRKLRLATAAQQIVSRASSGRAFTVTATAYTHTGNRTATGIWPKKGVVAVDPKVIPLGTKIYVEGYGEAIAADTGGVIKGAKIDVFLESYNECLQWGRRQVKIIIQP